MGARVAVITGGSSGIGLACAEALANRGYDLVLTARREEPLRAAAERLGANWICADASDDAQFAKVVSGRKRIDLLIHSAGILDGTYVRKERLDVFDAVLRANLRSAFVTTAAVLPVMPAGGRIVFVSSSASLSPMKGRSAYSASKAGLNAFAAAVGDEVLRDGINVNVIVPAPVDTPMLANVTFPMSTISASDVAAAVLFLEDLDPKVVVPQLALRAAHEGPWA
jgi:NAD(P)-dependent dehydrogenase (short-subunit alcohol dehydrogenase family)